MFYIDRCNLKLLRVDKSKETNNLFDLITSKWFIQHILGPTRFSDQQKSSLVDNIFINIKLKGGKGSSTFYFRIFLTAFGH